MRQSACLVFNPITVDNYAAFLNAHRSVRRQTHDGPDLKLFMLVGWGPSFSSAAWPTGVQLVIFFCSEIIGFSGISIVGQLTHSVSPRFWFIMEFIMIYLFVHDDSLTS